MMEIPNQYKQVWEAVRSHPFFQGVEASTALSLLQDCKYRIYEAKEILLYKNTQRNGLLLILEGIVEVYVENERNTEVLEVVQKGELLGFSSLADFLGAPRTIKDEVMVEARGVNQVKSLFIPFEVISRRWDDPLIRDYLLIQVSARLRDVYASLAEQVQLARDYGEHEAFMMRVQDVMTEKVVVVNLTGTIMEAAQQMNVHKTSSVLVMENSRLCGIITERDIVSRVVAKGVPFTHTVQHVMSEKPFTIPRFAYYYDAISTMLQHGIKHLPVVENDRVIGVVTLSDLLQKKNKNVMKTIKQIQEADEESLPNIKKAIYAIFDTLLHDHTPILKILDIVTSLYDRLIVRIVDLAIENLEEKGNLTPGVFALYQMGSSGRGEQFLLTDQDHFLVYQSDKAGYFEKLGKEITRLMEAAGYARCKGLMMCSEKQWRGDLIEWENRLRTWSLQSTRENLLLAQNFFSYRLITGNKDVHQQFEKMIMNLLDSSKIFIYRLAEVEREQLIPSLDQPIRSLFRLDKKHIDMKKSVLFPYHHSLQILALLHGIPSGTSMKKINSLKEKGVISKEFSQDLMDAASQILTLYVKQRWKQMKKGERLDSIIHFTRLTSREKEELILSLKTLKELQSLVFARFSV